MKLTIKAKDIRNAVAYESDDPGPIIIRDAAGEPILIIVNLAGDTWGIANPNDEDWDAVKSRYGII
jgi:hypothetical protein